MFNSLIDRSNSNAEKYRLNKAIFGTDDLIPMWVADMDISTPDFIVEALQNRVEHHIYGYESMADSAFKAQLKWLKRRHGYDAKQEWMIFSPSVVSSINIAIQAYTNQGDSIIVQDPVYFPFFKSIKKNKRKVIYNRLIPDKDNYYSFDLEGLKKQIDKNTKMLILCSPHNPVGRVWREDELRALADICVENNILVFSDEIHSDLVYKPNKHIPFASLGNDNQNLTITAVGPGKTFNLAGVATSTVIIENRTLRRKFKNVADSIHIGEGNIFGHIAFEAAYSKEADKWVDSLLDHLQGNVRELQSLTDEFSDLISMQNPEGTYLAWLDCSKMNLSNKELSHFFIKKVKLGLCDGFLYGKSGSAFMRINFAVPTPLMMKAIQRLRTALKDFRKVN